MIRDIILGVFGGDQALIDNPLLFMGHLGMIIMMILHIPFIFYIGKEHILQSIDEYQKSSLSQMVDRIRDKYKGDPRFFLVQKKFLIKETDA